MCINYCIKTESEQREEGGEKQIGFVLEHDMNIND